MITLTSRRRARPHSALATFHFTLRLAATFSPMPTHPTHVSMPFPLQFSSTHAVSLASLVLLEFFCALSNFSLLWLLTSESQRFIYLFTVLIRFCSPVVVFESARSIIPSRCPRRFTLSFFFFFILLVRSPPIIPLWYCPLPTTYAFLFSSDLAIFYRCLCPAFVFGFVKFLATLLPSFLLRLPFVFFLRGSYTLFVAYSNDIFSFHILWVI